METKQTTATNEVVQQSTLTPRQTHTVSRETQNFIDCLVSMQDLYGQVSESIRYLYGDIDENKTMVDDFWVKYNELWDVIKDFTMSSIGEKLGDRGTTEI